MRRRRRAGGERGQVAVAAIAVIALLAVVGGGLAALARAALVQSRSEGVADQVALAAAGAMRDRYDDLFPRLDSISRRSLPPALDRAAYERAALTAATAAARARGAAVVTIEFGGGHGPGPLWARVQVRLLDDGLPSFVGASQRRAVRSATARAGLSFGQPVVDPASFRAVDLTGFAGAAAVVAAAEAQLGWPYLWGGDSRADGGFDCSGLVDHALAAAGYPVGRLTAAGLQAAAVSVPLDAATLVPGDLVFVGLPAHHVGLVAGPGLVIEAPHTGAVVHFEALAAGGWTSAGRLPMLSAGVPGGVPVPDWVPAAFRGAIVEGAVAESIPPALLAAQIEAESDFDARSVSSAGAEGPAQFLPATWAGDWNPYRDQSPFDIRFAVLAQARYLRLLLERSHGDVPRALAAYNAGWAGSSRSWPAETRAYVAQIMRRFGGASTIAVASLAPGVGAPTGTTMLSIALEPLDAVPA